MRLFVSIDLPDDLAEAISTVQEELDSAAGLRMTDPSQAHVTLKFLGETDRSRVDEITDALATAVEQAGISPFEATIEGLGVFPELSYIRVVWVGVDEGGPEMTELHDAVETQLVDRGFDPADHTFTPHVTIARMDHAGGKEHVQQVVTERDPHIGRMEVDSISLTKSTLTAEKPIYETVATIPLSEDGA